MSEISGQMVQAVIHKIVKKKEVTHMAEEIREEIKYGVTTIVEENGRKYKVTSYKSNSGNGTATVYVPVRTPEEEAKWYEDLKKATAEFMKAVFAAREKAAKQKAEHETC